MSPATNAATAQRHQAGTSDERDLATAQVTFSFPVCVFVVRDTLNMHVIFKARLCAFYRSVPDAFAGRYCSNYTLSHTRPRALLSPTSPAVPLARRGI